MEWRLHRDPMHRRPVRWLWPLFERHARRHHRFYRHDAMSALERRDFHMVMFPPPFAVAFLAIGVGVIGFAVGAVAGRNTGLLYAATATLYYWTYEMLHLSYHLPESSRIAQWPLLRTMRRHHRVHHDPRLMRTWNFNLGLPLADWLHGTLWREEAAPREPLGAPSTASL
jgi:hypothetical protein